MFRILAITATLLGVMSAAHADVWRWTDPQGHPQYSDRWVPGSVLIKTDKSHPNPGSPPASTEQQKLAASNQTVAQQLAQQGAQQAVKQDVDKARDQQCKDASTRYEKAIQSRRIYREGKDGAREFVSDAEADAYRLQLFNLRKEACGK